MRKLILATAIILLSSSAFAGPRGLSSTQPAEPQKPVRQAEVTILPAPDEQPAARNVELPLRVEVPPLTVEEKLKAAGEIKSDGTPVARPVEAAPVQATPVQAKPVEAQAPVQTQPAAKPVEAQAPVQAQPEQQPVKKRVAKRESDEQKARRIAARFGISW